MVHPDAFESATDSNYLDLRRRDLTRTYRPQREWINGRGVLIVVAHFFSGIGAGTWLFAVVFEYSMGLLLALVCIALSGVAHLAFLGRWERFWRILARPNSSWISRGMWGIIIFSVAAIGYLLPWNQDSAMIPICLSVSLLGMTIVLFYEGFVYAASKAIPFWHTLLLPALYIAYGLRGGAALLLTAAAVGGGRFDIDTMEAIKLWVLVSALLLVLLYLTAARRTGGAAGHSAELLIAGRISMSFYGGTVGVGIAIPLILASLREFGLTGMIVLGLIGITSLIGDFYIKYCVVKAGAYVPLSDRLSVDPIT